MKPFALILGTIVLFLALKPGLDMISLQGIAGQVCCIEQCKPIADAEHSPDRPEKSDCPSNACNPFQVCSSCILLCLSDPFVSLTKPDISTKQIFTYQSAFISQFTPDFWQPPKIV